VRQGAWQCAAWCMAVFSCAHGSVLLSGSAAVCGNAAVYGPAVVCGSERQCDSVWQCERLCEAGRAAMCCCLTVRVAVRSGLVVWQCAAVQ